MVEKWVFSFFSDSSQVVVQQAVRQVKTRIVRRVENPSSLKHYGCV
jgi:hypothetical protein